MCSRVQSERDITKYSAKVLKRLSFKFLVDDIHKVILRSVPKTGCSSWKTMLIMNSPQYNDTIEDVQPHNWDMMEENYGLRNLMNFARPGILQRISSHYFIMTVRHPFSRLESAFMDKLVNNGMYGNDRDKDPVAFHEKTVYIYFQRFLDTVVRDLKQAKRLNGHWRPIVQHTHPCLFPSR